MQGEPEQQGQDIIVELANRLRILESKYSLMSERLLIVNQNMIEHHKMLTKEIKSSELEIRDVKNDLEKAKNILKHLSEEAANFARKEDIKVLEKYIKLWNPINFVSETDVKNIIQREMRRQAEMPKPAPKPIADKQITPIKKEVIKNA